MLSSINWSIPKENLDNYKVVYNSLNPIDGKLAGSKVKPYMMNSKLPVDILTKVWDLSDIDQDGFLNMKEFILVSISDHNANSFTDCTFNFSHAISLPRPHRVCFCLHNFHLNYSTLIHWKQQFSN